MFKEIFTRFIRHLPSRLVHRDPLPLLQSEIYGILGTIGEESGEQGYSTLFVGI